MDRSTVPAVITKTLTNLRRKARIAQLDAFIAGEGWPEYTGKIALNNPALKGTLAGKKLLFGPRSRFAIAPLHTRFDAVAWAVYDAQSEGSTMNEAELICVCNDTREAFRVAAAMLELESA